MAQRPKRRKSSSNPYTITCYEDKKLYIVKFKDCFGKMRAIKISEQVFKAFDRFELDDIKEMNEYDRYIEHSEVYEESLYNRVSNKPTLLDDYIIQKTTFEELKKAIDIN